MTKSRLISIEQSGYTVALYGPNRPHDRRLPKLHGGKTDRVCLIKSASDSYDRGFGQIEIPVFGKADSDESDNFADGVILTESGSSAVMFTADCLACFLYERTHGRAVFIHCGRPALTPRNNHGDPICNIVTKAYEILTADIVQPVVEACLIGGISAENFLHDDPKGQKLIKPFDQFGSDVFLDRSKGTLDLRAVVTKQLLGFGVNKNNIFDDGFCTFRETDLASFRRNQTSKRNAIVVVLKKGC